MVALIATAVTAISVTIAGIPVVAFAVAVAIVAATSPTVGIIAVVTTAPGVVVAIICGVTPAGSTLNGPHYVTRQQQHKQSRNHDTSPASETAASPGHTCPCARTWQAVDRKLVNDGIDAVRLAP